MFSTLSVKYFQDVIKDYRHYDYYIKKELFSKFLKFVGILVETAVKFLQNVIYIHLEQISV